MLTFRRILQEYASLLDSERIFRFFWIDLGDDFGLCFKIRQCGCYYVRVEYFGTQNPDFLDDEPLFTMSFPVDLLRKELGYE